MIDIYVKYLSVHAINNPFKNILKIINLGFYVGCSIEQKWKRPSIIKLAEIIVSGTLGFCFK